MDAFGKGNQDENDIAAKYENLEKTNSCNDQNSRKRNPSFFSYDEQTDTPIPTEKSIPEVMAAVAAMVEEQNLGNRKQEATDAPNPTEENIPKDMAAQSAVGKERKIVDEYPNLPSEEEFLEAYAGGHQATAQFPVLGHLFPEEYTEYHQQYLAQVEELHNQQFRTQVEGWHYPQYRTQVEGWRHFILQTQLQARLRNISNQQGRGGPYGRYGRGAQPHGEHN